MRTFLIMLETEFKLALREFSSILFGIIFPICLAAFLCIMNKGDVLKNSLSFASIITIGICATGLMGIPLTLSDYRHNKILKRYKVTPVSPGLLLFAQVVLNFLFALLATVGVCITCRLIGKFHFAGNLTDFILAYGMVTISIYSLGICIASIAPNIKIANLLCTLLYFPMLFLSGATVPYESMPKILQQISDVLPLTEGIKLLKAATLNQNFTDYTLSTVYLLILSIICVTLSLRYFRWE